MSAACCCQHCRPVNEGICLRPEAGKKLIHVIAIRPSTGQCSGLVPKPICPQSTALPNVIKRSGQVVAVMPSSATTNAPISGRFMLAVLPAGSLV